MINARFFLNVSSQIMSLCPYKVLRRPIIYALLFCLFYFFVCFRNPWDLSYFIISVLCSHYSFWCSRYPVNDSGSWVSFFFLMDSLLLGTVGYFRFILYLSCPRLDSAICPESTGSFHWEVAFRDNSMDIGDTPCF